MIMRKLVWEFLNTSYEGVVIYHQVFNLSDKLAEKFITDRGDGIVEFSRSHRGNQTRTRVKSLLRGDIRRYFGINTSEINMYVLEWCRDKSVKTIAT